jgi:hypothetical protein
MVNWQVTTTTIYCDAIDEEVTVLVYKNGAIDCTGYARYGKPGRDSAGLLAKKSRRLNKKLGCDGPECQRTTQYRDKLFAEEVDK